MTRAELNLADYPPEVLNTIAGVLRDRMHVEEGYMILSERFDAAAHVIEALRSLPVDQRMEAMGMVPCFDSMPCDGTTWHEVKL